MDIKVNVRESEGDAYVVDLTGEIDVYTSPKVKDAITELIDQEHYNLVISSRCATSIRPGWVF